MNIKPEYHKINVAATARVIRLEVVVSPERSEEDVIEDLCGLIEANLEVNSCYEPVVLDTFLITDTEEEITKKLAQHHKKG